MGLFSAAADLRDHQKECLHAQEVARQEARQDAAENRQLLRALEDKTMKAIERLEENIVTRMTALHADNQRDIQSLWRILWAAGSTVIMILLGILLAQHGVIGAIKGL